MALGHGGLLCVVAGTVAASWPIRNIMRQQNRSPPPLVLHFGLEWGGHFSPESVHRHHCRVASHSDGSKGHSHGMPAAVVHHPDRRETPPLAPEPVARTDGDRRNGCGRNATARSVDDLRRGHRRLKAIVPQDGPASSGAHIARLRRHGLRSVPGGDPAATASCPPAPTPARPGSPTPTAPGTNCAT